MDLVLNDSPNEVEQRSFRPPNEFLRRLVLSATTPHHEQFELDEFPVVGFHAKLFQSDTRGSFSHKNTPNWELVYLNPPIDADSSNSLDVSRHNIRDIIARVP